MNDALRKIGGCSGIPTSRICDMKMNRYWKNTLCNNEE
eukprot:UN07030